MANDKKFVVKNGLRTQNITFEDSVGGVHNINVEMYDTDTLSFEGNSGQLFSITDDMSGTIFAVNDISGTPSIEVDADGTARIAEISGNVLIGTATDDGTNILQVDGTIADATGNSTNWNTAYGWGDHSTAGYQSASSALTTSTTFGGDVSGTYNAIVIADDSHNHVISNVDGLQTALDAKQNSATALTTSTTFGGDVSGTYNAIVIADDSHNHVISNVDGLQTALNAKAPLASPALTGTPTAPTATAGTNTTQVATTAFVSTAVSNLVDSAPATLDTLNELAAALGDDPNFATTVTNSIGTTWTQDNTKISNWDTAYSWGDHSTEGYLTSFTETDPTVPAHVKSITTTEKTNWNTAYGWGDHSTAGYQSASTALTTSTTFGGDVSGTYNAIVVANDSHSHINYVLKTGDTMTGTLTYTTLNGPSTSSRDKIRVYGSGSYAIGMQNSTTYGGLNDWAMTFQMNNDIDRGFWWGHESHTTAEGAMSLTTSGHLFVGSRV